MVRETRIDKSALIYPVFVKEGVGIREEIPPMKGQFRYSVDQMLYELERISNAGVSSVMLFGIPEYKDEQASQAYAQEGIIQRALKEAKKRFPELFYITDVCLCQYTSHGHCGVLCNREIDNDATLKILSKTALSHAQAGADMVAPSDMMDGRVAAIRAVLDTNKYIHVPVMSYAVKYASGFYEPFREGAGSAPAFGDRKSYQMDYHNVKEALKEARQDQEQGADLLMVKPALSYLDVIRAVAEQTNLPLAAYSVSGEYAMIKAAAAAGLIDEYGVMCESAVSIFRAGADILISYYAKELAGYIDEGRIG